jgi:hypothetical protein
LQGEKARSAGGGIAKIRVHGPQNRYLGLKTLLFAWSEEKKGVPEAGRPREVFFAWIQVI